MHAESGMVVSGDDLYVCGIRSILVFSWSGELRHEIHGPWRMPSVLRLFEGRIYLLEAQEYELESDSAEVREAKQSTALRVVVLNLNGELLQEFRVPPRWLRGRLNDMVFFAGRLLLSCTWGRSLLALRP